MCGKTAVFGKSGLLGRHFYAHYRKSHPTMLATTRETLQLDNPTVPNLSGYAWALIAAGYGTPKRCEKDFESVKQRDLEGVLSIGKMCLKQKVCPIVFSSICVFDGREKGYTPCSPQTPLNRYGQLHAEREHRLLEALNGECLIIRISRVYSTKRADHTLLTQIAEQLTRGEKVRAATDQILQLIDVEDVVRGVVSLQEQGERGIHHLCAQEGVSRYTLACALAQALGVSDALVEPITMQEIDDIARPGFLDLVCSSPLRSWKEGVCAVVNQYR